ncbi:hypothetical protein [Marinobacterium rhizophilum]|nr:hypothetical protein [Marinobacterium rhizophilum]
MHNALLNGLGRSVPASTGDPGGRLIQPNALIVNRQQGRALAKAG